MTAKEEVAAQIDTGSNGAEVEEVVVNPYARAIEPVRCMVATVSDVGGTEVAVDSKLCSSCDGGQGKNKKDNQATQLHETPIYNGVIATIADGTAQHKQDVCA